MKLTFLGATHEVTGSCYYLDACGKKFLIDCGMEQGPDLYENKPIPVPVGDIDMVLLTHAHIDHSGLLPLLYKHGFRGQIFATGGTAALCRIMLLDSAHIQEFEAEWKNRKAERAGKEMVEPLYSQQDAEGAISCFVAVDYETEKYIADGVKIRFIDAGHLLGSSSIELTITEGDVTKTVVFSGDIGNKNQPLISNPKYLHAADYVIMESTYGDREHEKPEYGDYVGALADVIQRTFDRGGNVVIPSFAVGRTQEMLYFIREIKQQDMICGHDNFQVYVDSPLAIEATNIFMERMYSDFDDQAKQLLAEGVNPIGFAGLKTAVSSEESRAINDDPNPKIIISASGMCDAGRVKHHLKHNLWKEESTILFVGYQAVGTPGRAIIEGAESIRLFGEEIEVRAEICQLPGISGHADRDGLIRWAGGLERPPVKTFVVHGEDEVTDSFAETLRSELGFDADAPFSGTVYDLLAGEYVKRTEGVPYVKRDADGNPVKINTANATKAYQRLTNVAERLMSIVRRSSGVSNKDLARLADQLTSICDKWEQ